MAADELNARSYALHYRSLGQTEEAARQALLEAEASGTPVQRLEALNNLAFVSIARMRYAEADSLLGEIRGPALWDDGGDRAEIERLTADVQMMRLCQRQSRNKSFYDCLRSAGRSLARLRRRRDKLDARSRRRLVYAETEMAIVSSAYYYYVGLEAQSRKALLAVDQYGEVQGDSAQLVAYLYNVGAGGIVQGETAEAVALEEFDYLATCYQAATRRHYAYFEANALLDIARLLADESLRDAILAHNYATAKVINPRQLPADSLPLDLSRRGLEMFKTYGDVYQTAGAYRTLAGCLWAKGRYREAELALDSALMAPEISQAPDLVASIHEKYSVVAAYLGDKPSSDSHRNQYLDIQDSTRQDRYYESRRDELSRQDLTLSRMEAAAMALLGCVAALTVFFFFLYKRRNRRLARMLDKPLADFAERDNRAYEALQERVEEACEERLAAVMRKRSVGSRFLESRAKRALASSVLPLIDRLQDFMVRMQRTEDTETRASHREYVSQLAAEIIRVNGVLTAWIQLERGRVNMRIETCKLQDLFAIVRAGEGSLRSKGLTLNVDDTPLAVRADRALTLFMVNTLVGNAARYTPRGGSITIAARDSVASDGGRDEGNGYVEVSVADTGCGMSAETLADVFSRTKVRTRGFGLLNCRGIIDGYRKLGRLFAGCSIDVESRVGQGSRFTIRLPKAALPAVLLLLFCGGGAAARGTADVSPLSVARDYADSAYFANVRGDYSRTIEFADSCLCYLNLHVSRWENSYHRGRHRGRSARMSLCARSAAAPAELVWYRDSVRVNYNVILDIRNEAAVAALALRRIALYEYNNAAYTSLYKEMSADSTLPAYCGAMEQRQASKRIWIGVIVAVGLLLPTVFVLLFYRPGVRYRRRRRQLDTLAAALDAAGDISELLPDMTQTGAATDGKSYTRQETAARAQLDDRASRRRKLEDALTETEELTAAVRQESDSLYVADQLLTNSLSALKHETMYFPERIYREISGSADTDMAQLCELTAYYRGIYSTLLDSTAECRAPKTADADSLLPLLKKAGGDVDNIKTRPCGNGYTDYEVPVSGRRLGFDAKVENIPLLTARQLVRELSDAAGGRQCGIQTAEGAYVVRLPDFIVLAEGDKPKDAAR